MLRIQTEPGEWYRLPHRDGWAHAKPPYEFVDAREVCIHASDDRIALDESLPYSFREWYFLHYLPTHGLQNQRRRDPEQAIQNRPFGTANHPGLANAFAPIPRPARIQFLDPPLKPRPLASMSAWAARLTRHLKMWLTHRFHDQPLPECPACILRNRHSRRHMKRYRDTA